MHGQCSLLFVIPSTGTILPVWHNPMDAPICARRLGGSTVISNIQEERCASQRLPALTIGVETLGPPYGFWTTFMWGALAIVVPNAIAVFWYQFMLRADPSLYEAMGTVGSLGGILVVAVAIRLKNWSFLDYLRLNVPSWRAVLLGLAIAIGLLLVKFTFGQFSKPLFTWHPVDLQPMHLLAILVVAPVAEELLMRGFMYSGIARSVIGAAGAIVFLAVIFAALHEGAYIWHFGSGLMLGWLRWRTNSVTVPILAHATMNFGNLIIEMQGYVWIAS
jgi:membrane protease YdiL (CAAX protease family)